MTPVMRKFIITTALLLAAMVAITVVYFKNISTPTAHTTRVMESIPNSAALIFEFSNDDGFYDIFSNNNLLTSLIGTGKIQELSTLRTRLLTNPLLNNFFTGQHIFISLHGQERDSVDFLITIAGGEKFNSSHLDQLVKQPNKDIVVNTLNLAGKEAYNIYFNDLKKRFYLVNHGNHILSGSFLKIWR
jgi:hypothetical protein